MKFFEKFKQVGSKHVPPNTACPINDNATPVIFKCPMSMYRLGPDENTSIDVELYHTGELLRIYGFDGSSTCVDFTVNLCQLLKLKPSHYCLMVSEAYPHDSSPTSWQRAPPSSKLSMWLETSSGKNHGFVRLVHKSYVAHILKPSMTDWRPKNNQSLADPVSGREMLEQMGERIVVHLPGGRKTVVRARLSQPLAGAVIEVCNQRNLSPTEYFLQNPRTCSPLDPSLSFAAQNVHEFELKPCHPESSNLTSINTIHRQMIDQADSAAKLKQLDPNIPPISHKRLRSPTESRIYANTQRPHTLCTGYPTYSSGDLDISAYATLDRPLSTISSKSRKKRMAPPPPSIGAPIAELPQQHQLILREQQQQKRSHTRSALTLHSADLSVLSSAESGQKRYRRRSASLKGSPYLPRSVFYSAKTEEDQNEEDNSPRSPITSFYSESFLPQSARAYEPKSDLAPPTLSVSAVSLPLTIIARLDKEPETISDKPVDNAESAVIPLPDNVGVEGRSPPVVDEPPPQVETIAAKCQLEMPQVDPEVKATPEAVLPSTVTTALSSSSANKIIDDRPTPIPPALMQQLQKRLSELPDRADQSSTDNVTSSQLSEVKEKPFVAPRPSMDVLLQHPKYRQLMASSVSILRPNSASGDGDQSTPHLTELKKLTLSEADSDQLITVQLSETVNMT